MSRRIDWLIRAVAPATIAYAHCDIPCGIYDPHQMMLAAATVAKMVELINRLNMDDPADRHHFNRCVTVKEEYAETVKHEVQVIWSDYFKPEHLDEYPYLHTKVWNLLKLASKNKRSVDPEAAAQLQAAVKEFADIFWATKS
jgi:nickel superoxide dismutase